MKKCTLRTNDVFAVVAVRLRLNIEPKVIKEHDKVFFEFPISDELRPAIADFYNGVSGGSHLEYSQGMRHMIDLLNAKGAL